MKKMIYLLVSAVALLFGSALPHPTTKENHILNEIIDQAIQYNKSLHKDLFVEDVSALASANCDNKFLCKVLNIFETHTNFSKRTNERKIMKNLHLYINGTKENCTELIKDVPATGRETEIPELLNSLIKCIKEINFKG